MKTAIYAVLYIAVVLAATFIIMDKADAQYYGTQPTQPTQPGLINRPMSCTTQCYGNTCYTNCF